MLRFPFLVGPKGVVKKSLSIVVEKDGRFFSWFSGFAIPRSSKVIVVILGRYSVDH